MKTNKTVPLKSKKTKAQSAARFTPAGSSNKISEYFTPFKGDHESVEGDDDDDQWTLASTPDIQLLTSARDEEDVDMVDAASASSRVGPRVLATATPTKMSRSMK